MVFFYKVWLITYKLFCKYSTQIEKFIFLSNYNDFYKYNSYYKSSVLQKIIMILFYTPLNLKKITIFFNHLDKIYDYRLCNYTKLSVYFSKEMQTHNPFIVKNKYIYSSIKNNNVKYVISDVEFIIGCVNAELLNSIKFLSYWIRVNNDFPLKNHIKSQKTIVIYNDKTFKGFIKYISDDFSEIVANKIDGKNPFFNKYVNINKIPKNFISSKLIKRDFAQILTRYNKFYSTLNKFNEKKNNSFTKTFLKILKFDKISLDANFKNFYQILYPIKYKPTDATYYLELNNKITCFFLRKNKIFNKGRYSRNRQLYRTGVYWCLWLNIINVFGLYYYFYRFVFNFGYFYLPLLLLILSIFGSRLVKYRFYKPLNILNELNSFTNLLYKLYDEIIKIFFKKVKSFLTKFFKLLYYCILLFLKK